MGSRFRKEKGWEQTVMPGVQNVKKWLKTVFKELPLPDSSHFMPDCQL